MILLKMNLKTLKLHRLSLLVSDITSANLKAIRLKYLNLHVAFIGPKYKKLLWCLAWAIFCKLALA